MKSKIELLAPGGDLDSIKAAILAGADAVYCGLDRFNARNRAENITFDDLNGILALAHDNDCEVFLTINILIVESELPAFIKLLNKIVNTTIDGVIVQDLGALYLLKKYFPTLKVHASTQMTTHNEGQIEFLKQLSVTRVNLSRELNLGEITDLTKTAHENDIATEVFVHGANCISFSGLCYFSSVHGGNSGNRGRCSQQCRSQYETTAQNQSFPLNLKDNSAFDNLNNLKAAGVDSLKIEGRIKKFDYVYTVVNAWRKHISSSSADPEGKEILYKVFNRDLTNGFLSGEIGKHMFIDNPRDNSARNLAKQKYECNKAGIDKARDEINAERALIMEDVKARIAEMDISGNEQNTHSLNKKIPPVKIPPLSHNTHQDFQTKMSVLISTENDLSLCEDPEIDIYFQLPSDFENNRDKLLKLFTKNKRLIPWFPAVLIGDEFHHAVTFMKEIEPRAIATNNTGIAFEAFRLGIPWIAGPYMNIANSYSLLCLKEHFDCRGAFISNELSRNQIGAIKAPDNFNMYYSIYHPITLMTSRQCLFHTVTGCNKNTLSNSCITNCEKSSSITNMQGTDFIIEKKAGSYHKVYNDTNFFNLDIVNHIPNRFTGFLIDLGDVQTKTQHTFDKSELISLFKECLNKNQTAAQGVKGSISPWINTSYKKGI